jgi:hypothetical protein
MKIPYLFILLFFSILRSQAQTSSCEIGNKLTEVQVGQIRTYLDGTRQMFNGWEQGYFWPQNSTKGLINGSGIFWSGIDSASGELHLAVQYKHGGVRNFWPGPIVPGTSGSPGPEYCEFWDRHFRITRSSLDLFLLARQTNPLPLHPALIPMEVQLWPAKSNPMLKQTALAQGLTDLSAFDQDLAPFVDVDGDQVYNPQQGDYPDMGNKSVLYWWVMNDISGTKVLPGNLVQPKAHIEFQGMLYGYAPVNQQAYLDNTLFLDWKITNKGDKVFHSGYVSVWMDPNIGNKNDDYLMSHPMKNLGIAYNGDPVDEGPDGYGSNPPVLAVKILDAPGPLANQDGHDNNQNGIIDEAGEHAIYTGFLFHNIEAFNTGSPTKATDFYNYQRMRWQDGRVITPWGSGSPNPNPNGIRYFFPGENDPYGFTLGCTVLNPCTFLLGNWTEVSSGNPPGDRRFIMSSGPFGHRPGQDLHFSYAHLIGHGSSISQNLQQVYAISDSLDLFLRPLTSASKPQTSQNSHLRLFPQPARGIVHLQCTEPALRVEILSLSGQTLRSEAQSQSQQDLSLSGLSPGLYLVRAHFRDGVQTEKLVVE